jgi:hypothetical protein
MKAYKNVCFLTVLGLFLGVFLFYAPSVLAVENVSTIPAGFYQFNNLEIFKNPSGVHFIIIKMNNNHSN